MTPRLNPFAAAPQLMQAVLDLEAQVKQCGLEHSLIELVKVRASQLNGCAYCIHMHTTDARAAGEREERLYLLDAWREAPLYTGRERAALGWTEALTRGAPIHARDADYAALQAEFSAEEQVKLTVLIGMINLWNRIAIGFASVPDVGR
ncbi:carboxymuconolactone decarboxylase family protein [Jeongeupia wiesaeckerbachi]